MSRYWRQLDIVDQPRLARTPITVIGAGAIGSFTVLALAKSGAEHITVWDHDEVAEHNLPNQWFAPADVGEKKVYALAGRVREMTGVMIRAVPHRYDTGPLGEVAICAVDSMDARIAIWGSVKASRPALWIDARMGAEVGRVLVVGGFGGWYDDTLHPSSEAFQAPCTARATMFCAAGLAAFVSAQVVHHVSGRPVTPDITVDFRNSVLLQPNQLHRS